MIFFSYKFLKIDLTSQFSILLFNQIRPSGKFYSVWDLGVVFPEMKIVRGFGKSAQNSLQSLNDILKSHEQ